MRTTLVIDDALLRQAKQHAAGRGMSLSELVSVALRSALARAEHATPPPFEMVTYGRGPTAQHEPADFAAIAADEDAEGLEH
jgi:hypothetical protein